MLEAIDYIGNIRKKKVTKDKIVTYLNNAGASNWDKESVEGNLKEMQTKGILIKTINLWLHCHQILTTFPSYRMMFELHSR